jgi:ribosome biogenesis GTPase
MSQATVRRVDARGALVERDGEILTATLRGALFRPDTWATRPVAVGDRVRLEGSGGDLTIAEVLPRRSAFLRAASSEDPRAQVVAANVDAVAVVASLGRPGFSSTFADRVLAGASAAEIPTLLVLNKIDLGRKGEAEAVAETYRRAGVRVLPTSARDSAGIEALAAALAGRVTVLTGLSGVGKSSLLNALVAGLDRRVGLLSEKWRQGRHTTAAAEWVPLPGGGAAIDTPGVRGFLPWGVHRGSLRHCFPDLEPLLGRCRFADCSHHGDSGCALEEAVARGELAPTRVASYREIAAELPPPPEAWSEGARPERTRAESEDAEDDPDRGGAPGDPHRKRGTPE